MTTETFYFSPVPTEFKDPEVFGNQFYYKMEVTDEGEGNGTFTISDTCGRYLPFDFNQLEDLADIVTLLALSVSTIRNAKA